MSGVAAIAFGQRADWNEAAARERLSEAVAVASLADVRDAAERVGAPLVWLLDSGAAPADGALQALVDAAHTPAVSMPVDEHGAPVEPLLGRFTESDKAAMLDAASRGRVPLRHTRVVSMLVDRATLLEHHAPDVAGLGPYAGSEWTARVFARTRGMLVPSSTVRVASPGATSLRHALRMARTGVWRRGETLRELERCLVRR